MGVDCGSASTVHGPQLATGGTADGTSGDGITKDPLGGHGSASAVGADADRGRTAAGVLKIESAIAANWRSRSMPFDPAERDAADPAASHELDDDDVTGGGTPRTNRPAARG
jgi:hypothetical protein